MHGHTINMHAFMVNIAFKNLCGKPLVSSVPKHLEKETKSNVNLSVGSYWKGAKLFISDLYLFGLSHFGLC